MDDQDAICYFILGHDFTGMLSLSDGSPEAIDELVAEGLKYNTGERVCRGLKMNSPFFEIRPKPFRKAVIYTLNYYWGHNIPT